MNRALPLVILVIVVALRAQPAVSLVVSPAPANSGQACVSRGDDGKVRLSWVQRQGRSARLAFSTLNPEGWSAPKAIAEGSRWFVNWADVPSLAADKDGRLAAHWLDRLGDDSYAYGIRIATSTDAGTSWSKPRWLHDDLSPQEHGFCSLRPIGDGAFRAVWLDGRALKSGAREMQLRTRAFDVHGARGLETLLDSRVCECCPTALVGARKGQWLVAYRDRSKTDVRDIAFVRWDGDRDVSWSKPAPVAVDGWERPG